MLVLSDCAKLASNNASKESLSLLFLNSPVDLPLRDDSNGDADNRLEATFSSAFSSGLLARLRTCHLHK